MSDNSQSSDDIAILPPPPAFRPTDPRVWEDAQLGFEVHANTSSRCSFAFAKCVKEGIAPWRMSDVIATTREPGSDEQEKQREAGVRSCSVHHFEACSTESDLIGLGRHFDSTDMHPARTMPSQRMTSSEEGGELDIDDDDGGAILLEQESNSQLRRGPSQVQGIWTHVPTAEDRAEREETSMHEQPGPGGQGSNSTRYVVSRRSVVLLPDHRRRRPGITTSTDLSESDVEEEQGAVRRYKGSVRPCDECGGKQGRSRAWVFDVPIHQRSAYRREDYNRSFTPAPSEPPELHDEDSSSFRAPHKPSQGPSGFHSPTPPPEIREKESEDEDLSHLARVVCRTCEETYHRNTSLPFTHLHQKEAGAMARERAKQEEEQNIAAQLHQRSADLSTAELWTVIKKHCLEGLTDPSTWPSRVRAHALWTDFASRKCLGPSNHDNFCWEDKDPAERLGPSCQAYEALVRARKETECGQRGCGGDSQTWWTAPRRSRKVYKTPLCDDCEEVIRDERWCFTCATHLEPDDIAGRCSGCYKDTAMNGDWKKVDAFWCGGTDGDTYLKGPWVLMQEDRLKRALE